MVIFEKIFKGLITKKAEAVDVKDFGPISLMGSIYKIKAKVLLNRLKNVLGELVFYTQNAFIHGREILDLLFIANELSDSMLNTAICSAN